VIGAEYSGCWSQAWAIEYTIKYLRGAAGIGLGTTTKYLRGAAGISLGTTIKYLRRTTSAAANNSLGKRSSTS
jgi:hypothetical protein